MLSLNGAGVFDGRHPLHRMNALAQDQVETRVRATTGPARAHTLPSRLRTLKLPLARAIRVWCGYVDQEGFPRNCRADPRAGGGGPFFCRDCGSAIGAGLPAEARRPPHEAQTDSQTTKYSSQWAAEHALITPLPDKKLWGGAYERAAQAERLALNAPRSTPSSPPCRTKNSPCPCHPRLVHNCGADPRTGGGA